MYLCVERTEDEMDSNDIRTSGRLNAQGQFWGREDGVRERASGKVEGSEGHVHDPRGFSEITGVGCYFRN